MTRKTPIISINVFAHARRRYIKTNFLQLIELERSLKNEIQVNIVADNHFTNGISGIARNLNKSGVRTKLVFASNYLKKVEFASKVKTPLVAKIDEDIFLTTANWEKFLSDSFNFGLDNEVLSPLISSGVPSVEYFIDNFLTNAESVSLREAFSKFVFIDAWGVDFSSLQAVYTKNEFVTFFNAVSKLDHHYKGIHPIRFSSELQRNLVEIIKNSSTWLNPIHSKGFMLDTISPYFCNSFFVSSTKIYRMIFDGLTSGKYFTDGFEEVALNQYLNQNARPMYFNHGVAAIHPSYWTADETYSEISDDFYEFCKSGLTRKEAR